MLATVAAAAFNMLSIEREALSGAVAAVLLGCISPRQAYQAIDTRIYVFIAGAVPLGDAMQKSGTSDLLAGWIQTAIGGWNQMLITLVLFAIVGVLTQFMSDAAMTALFAPVAPVLAQTLGHPPESYVVTVAVAAVASFLSPPSAIMGTC
jgi:di/tricarboxylate transporter